jgi:Mlc titration factor MtfA (ptsG expression regulator)
MAGRASGKGCVVLGRWRNKRRLRRGPFPEDWLVYVARSVTQWPALDEDERTQLLDDVVTMLVDKRWEAAQGFDLTDEIRVTIAAQASMLILGLEHEDPYRNVGTIIVHPTTMYLPLEQPGPVPGTVLDSPLSLLGLAEYDGPVIVAWDSVSRVPRLQRGGHNVVYHEFAHKLDFADGVIDGTPRIDDHGELRRWVDVCTAEFEALQRGDTADDLLDMYAATNVAEFFAVVTEVFFERPIELEAAKPELYAVMRAFYNQDPAARLRRADRR